ncbi:MAG: DUF6069 family protein [Gordonia sp. (in: high G+C Gram-positive bacteria)]|uniref:DUF6069 family protein n=1 Tax=Gordonia sp. (in: high G+C Gram-positive bacteria) TaxID=84139 RepID=UPI003C77D5BC
MTYNDPRDPYRDEQPPQTRAYSRPGDYHEYGDSQYRDSQYPDYPYPPSQYPQSQNPESLYPQSKYPQAPYPQSQYPESHGSESPYDPRYGGDGGYQQAPAAAPRKAPRRGPDVDPLMFCGGVLMTGVVTGLAAWLAAWIIRAITEKVNASGQLGVWNPLAQDEVWFALTGFVVAIVGGALWYLLQVATPTPDQFYSWVVGLLVAAAVILPLFLSQEISSGIGTAVMHFIIGMPVLTLIPTMGRASRRKK